MIFIRLSCVFRITGPVPRRPALLSACPSPRPLALQDGVITFLAKDFDGRDALCCGLAVAGRKLVGLAADAAGSLQMVEYLGERGGGGPLAEVSAMAGTWHRDLES